MRIFILFIVTLTLASASKATPTVKGIMSAYDLLEDAKGQGGETYAPDVMKEAQFFYEQAERELKNGNDERAEEFRLISEISSKTAISLSRKKIYENELQVIKSQMDETNAIKKNYEGELRKNVTRLEEIKEKLAISQDRMLSSALDTLEKASERINAAENVSAQDFNPQALDEARQTYSMAEENLTLSEYQKSIELGEKAIVLAEIAYEQSKTKFELRSGILDKVSSIYGAKIEPVKDGVKVNLHGVFAPSGTTILFDAFPSLDALASVLSAYSNLPVTIEGYATEQKSEEENIKLGETQVETVKNYLVSKGLSPQRFKVMSAGLGVKEGVKEDSRIEVIIHLFELSNT